jgi:hypothetical protein
VAHRQRNFLGRVFPRVQAQLPFWREHRALDCDGVNAPPCRLGRTSTGV